MKAILICPNKRPGVDALARRLPLAVMPFLGKPLIEYWIAFLAGKGVHSLVIYSVDRVEAVRSVVQDGARWGMEIEVVRVPSELTIAQARLRHGIGPDDSTDTRWLSSPHDVSGMDRLPGAGHSVLFRSYASFFAAACEWMAHATTPDRVGIREWQPGITVARNTKIPRSARLIAPCWIGDRVIIEPYATIGPNAIIEERAFIKRRATIARSVIGPETMVGRQTTVRDSIAWGSTLIDHKTGACSTIKDPFLLASLVEPSIEPSPQSEVHSNKPSWATDTSDVTNSAFGPEPLEESPYSSR